MLVHGREHSGASLLPITVAAQLHKEGSKLLIFTAYPMAKEEFLEQLGELGKTVLCLESEADINKAEEFQTIIVKSGDEALFLSVLEQFPNLPEYIPFIKNIEVITEQDIIEYAVTRPSIIAGDATKSPFFQQLQETIFITKILFTPFEEESFPGLQKYSAKMAGKNGECVVSVK